MSRLGKESSNEWIRKSARIPGWLFPGEHEFLFAQALAAPAGNFVEIGVLFGKSACILCGALAERGRAERLYAVDPFTVAGDERDQAVHQSTHGKTNSFPDFVAHARALGYYDLMVPLATYSHRIIPLLHIPVALAFIDALHERTAVLNDFALVLPKCVPGARILFHDAISSPYTGVAEAVAEILRLHPHVREIGRAGSIIALAVEKKQSD